MRKQISFNTSSYYGTKNCYYKKPHCPRLE